MPDKLNSLICLAVVTEFCVSIVGELSQILAKYTCLNFIDREVLVRKLIYVMKLHNVIKLKAIETLTHIKSIMP